MTKILITGAGGLVGSALVDLCVQNGDDVVACDHQSLDISDLENVNFVINNSVPDVVINCAAWTDVDGCEHDADKSDRVNAIGPENLARASLRVGARLITISTDYVFDGTKDGFYTQRDNPNPLGVYARSKLEGERRAQLALARTIVVRTGFIFGRGGKNFLSTLVDRVRAGEKVKAIADAWGTPTYANDLAERLRELADLDIPGTFHVVNSGEGTSYALFTEEALRLAGLESASVEVVPLDSLNRPAPRPRNSRLKCLLSEGLGLRPLPPWQEGLRHFLQGTSQKPIQKSQNC